MMNPNSTSSTESMILTSRIEVASDTVLIHWNIRNIVMYDPTSEVQNRRAVSPT